MSDDADRLARACRDAMYAGDRATRALGIEVLEVRPGHASAPDAPSPLVSLWAMRMLVKLGGHKHFIDHGLWVDEDLAAYLGLPAVPPDESDETGRTVPRQALALLKKRHALAEKEARQLPPPQSDTLALNSQRLAIHLGLSEVDREILAFVVSLHSEPNLEAAANCLGDLTTSKVHATLAAILDLDPHAVREALSRHGKLCSSGIITLCPITRTDLKNKLDILSSEFNGSPNNDANVKEDFLAIASVVPFQMFGFFKSLQLGLKPDAPSTSGAITRVVEGVHIYSMA